jgi:molybdopterin-guanine dinucleotide biosynthesis protein A
MYDNITGIILSGGKSTRMGENKSLMKIGNKTIIEHVKDLMQSLFSKVILIANDPDDYKFLNLKIYKDIYFRMGPLAGIHSGLTNTATEKNFIISCDIPLMTPEMIRYLVEYKTNKPVTIAKADGFIQQLCGIYNKSCRPYAENILSSNINDEERNEVQKKRGCKVLGLIDIVGAEIIEAEILPFYKKDMFFNMNKKSDYANILSKITVEN